MKIEEIKKLKLIHYCGDFNLLEKKLPIKNEFSIHSTNVGTRDPGVTFMCMNCGNVVKILETKDEEEEKFTLDEFKEMMEEMKRKKVDEQVKRLDLIDKIMEAGKK